MSLIVPRARPGMTIIEVMFAVVIMSGVMLALSRFGAAFTRATREAATLGIASDLATARLEVIRAAADYDELENDFEGTEADSTANPSLTGFDGYTRVTTVTERQTKVGSRVTVLYKTVTVRVTAPDATTVSKSLDISAP